MHVTIFQPDEIVLMKTPYGPFADRVNFRGPIGEDQAVVAPSWGGQMTVKMEWLSALAKHQPETT